MEYRDRVSRAAKNQGLSMTGIFQGSDYSQAHKENPTKKVLFNRNPKNSSDETSDDFRHPMNFKFSSCLKLNTGVLNTSANCISNRDDIFSSSTLSPYFIKESSEVKQKNFCKSENRLLRNLNASNHINYNDCNLTEPPALPNKNHSRYDESEKCRINVPGRLLSKSKQTERPVTPFIRSSEVYKASINSRSPTPEPQCRSITPTASMNVSLSISGIGPNHSEFKLREFCRGHDLISVSTSRNNITNHCNGTAEIIVKPSTDLNKLKSTLISEGFGVTQSVKNLGRRNNYNDISTHSFLNPFITAHSNNQYHLASSEGLFGSSPSVGSYTRPHKTPDKQALVLSTWNKILEPTKTPTKPSTFHPVCGFMKATLSSLQKLKNVNK